MTNSKPYIAASSYLNAAPLCYSFVYGEQRNRCEFLSDAAPARCAEMLAEGRADAALAASIFHDRIQGLGELKRYLGEQGISVRQTG